MQLEGRLCDKVEAVGELAYLGDKVSTCGGGAAAVTQDNI